MINIASMKIAILQWVISQTGLTDQNVVWMDNNATRPELPFIGLKFTAYPAIINDEIKQINDTEATVTGTRDFTLSIQGFGRGAENGPPPDDIFGKLDGLVTSLEIPPVRATLSGAGMVFYRTGPIQDLSWLDASQYKERGSLDCFIRTLSVVTFDQDTIGDVIGTGELVKPDQGIIDTEFTVTTVTP